MSAASSAVWKHIYGANLIKEGIRSFASKQVKEGVDDFFCHMGISNQALNMNKRKRRRLLMLYTKHSSKQVKEGFAGLFSCIEKLNSALNQCRHTLPFGRQRPGTKHVKVGDGGLFCHARTIHLPVEAV